MHNGEKASTADIMQLSQRRELFGAEALRPSRASIKRHALHEGGGIE